jgi:hypothetical protein
MTQPLPVALQVPIARPARVDSSRRGAGWLPGLLKVSCFVAIALGLLSLLFQWTGPMSGIPRRVLVLPDEALGLIFLGFAVRMSRLEAHRRTIRIIVKTSRACLLLLGLSAVAGLRLMEPAPGTMAAARGSGLAEGICFLAIGLILQLRIGRGGNRLQTGLTALLLVYLGSCWTSLLLATAGMTPTPEVLRLSVGTLAILTGIGVVLSTAARTPGVFRVLSQRGPEGEAARLLFPLAFAIPLLLAILRQRVEAKGLLEPDSGLLLHVLLSAGSMVAMMAWNGSRIHSEKRVRDSAGVVVTELAAQYRDIFAVVQDPVWMFSAEGQLQFQNEAAGRYGPPGETDSGVLGQAQTGFILSAALLSRRVTEMALRDRETGQMQQLPIRYLRALVMPDGEPGSIILVARGSAAMIRD